MADKVYICQQSESKPTSIEDFIKQQNKESDGKPKKIQFISPMYEGLESSDTSVFPSLGEYVIELCRAHSLLPNSRVTVLSQQESVQALQLCLAQKNKELFTSQVLLSYLHILVNSRSELALAKIFNVPHRELDRHAFTALKHMAQDKNMSMFQTATSFLMRIRLGGKSYRPDMSCPLNEHTKGVGELVDLIHNLQTVAEEQPDIRVACRRVLNIVKNRLIKCPILKLGREDVEGATTRLYNSALCIIESLEASNKASPDKFYIVPDDSMFGGDDASLPSPLAPFSSRGNSPSSSGRNSPAVEESQNEIPGGPPVGPPSRPSQAPARPTGPPPRPSAGPGVGAVAGGEGLIAPEPSARLRRSPSPDMPRKQPPQRPGAPPAKPPPPQRPPGGPPRPAANQGPPAAEGGSQVGRKTLRIFRLLLDKMAASQGGDNSQYFLNDLSLNPTTPTRVPSLLSQFRSPEVVEAEEESPEKQESKGLVDRTNVQAYANSEVVLPCGEKITRKQLNSVIVFPSKTVAHPAPETAKMMLGLKPDKKRTTCAALDKENIRAKPDLDSDQPAKKRKITQKAVKEIVQKDCNESEQIENHVELSSSQPSQSKKKAPAKKGCRRRLMPQVKGQQKLTGFFRV